MTGGLTRVSMNLDAVRSQLKGASSMACGRLSTVGVCQREQDVAELSRMEADLVEQQQQILQKLASGAVLSAAEEACSAVVCMSLTVHRWS
jgi:hypothetical protein